MPDYSLQPDFDADDLKRVVRYRSNAHKRSTPGTKKHAERDAKTNADDSSPITCPGLKTGKTRKTVLCLLKSPVAFRVA